MADVCSNAEAEYEQMLLDLQQATEQLQAEANEQCQIEDGPPPLQGSTMKTTTNATVLALDGCYGSTPLDLGNVAMGSNATEQFVLRNPSPKTQTITIERFPFAKGFTLHVDSDQGPLDLSAANPCTVTLEANHEALFYVGFNAPESPESKSYRHVANLSDGKRSYKLSLEVLAILPLKSKKHRVATKGITQATKQPRPVLATLNRQPSSKLRQVQLAKVGCSKPIDQPAEKRKQESIQESIHPASSTISTQSDEHPSHHSKQERAFTTWLNHVLIPQEGDNMYVEREYLKLRSRAQRLRDSPTVIEGLNILQESISNESIAAKEDSCIFLDIHLKEEVLRVFASYHPTWLRLGLEMLFGTTIQVEAVNAAAQLKSFVNAYILDNAGIRAQFMHPAIPSHLVREFHKAMSGHILLYLIGLVYFLDQARTSNLIPIQPRLFVSEAFKSSSAVLGFVSTTFLKGEGSLEKHLRYLGLTVSFKQSPMDEYAFEVKQLATDLRDGVRLWRVLAELSPKCVTYTPAISGNVAVWVKNNQQFFSALKAAGCKQFFPQRAAEDLANGHRDVTLAVLWATLVTFKICSPLDVALLQAEIGRVKRDPRYKPLDKRRASDANMYQNSAAMNLLLQWCRAICACFDLEISDFTTSFSDGRALCYLISYYHPQLLPASSIHTATTATIVRDHALDSHMDFIKESLNGFTCIMSPGNNKIGGRSRQQLLENEKANFRLISKALNTLGGVPLLAKSKDMSGTMPDERVVISYVSCLCSRLLDINQEQRACLVIQKHWHRYKTQRLREQAAKILQQRWRAVLAARAQRHQFLHTMQAIITIQATFRMAKQRAAFQHSLAQIVKTQACCRRWLARRQLFQLWQKREAAIRLQAVARGFLARMRFAQLRLAHQRHCAAVCIQRHILAWKARLEFKRAVAAATKIQAMFRGLCARRFVSKQFQAVSILQTHWHATIEAKRQRTWFLRVKAAASTLQTHWRLKIATQQTREICLRRRLAATVIQCYWRRYEAQQDAYSRRHAIVVLQTGLRSWLARRQLQQLRCNYAAAVTLQAAVRGALARADVYKRAVARERYFSAMYIQRVMRGALARRQFLMARWAAITIQSAYRGFVARQAAHRRLLAVQTLQERVRAWLYGRSVRHQYLQLKYAACVIQKHWRLKCEAQATRQVCAARREACIRIQSMWRMSQQRHRFIKIQKATLVLQSATRVFLARQELRYLRHRHAIIANFAQETLLHLAAITIQRQFRLWRLHTCAATVLQAAVRGFIARQTYQRKQSAILLLQRNIRGYQTRKAYVAWREERIRALTQASRCFFSTIIIQRAWRRYAIQRAAATRIQAAAKRFLAQQRYLRLKAATVQIQSMWRSVCARRTFHQLQLAAARRQRVLHFGARMFLAAVCIQRSFRAHMLRVRQHHAAVVIQRHFRSWKKLHSLEARETAATRIQAWYRAYRIRKQMSDRLRQIHQNVCEINKAYCAEATLGWKTNSALGVLLKYKKVSRVLEALRNLTRMASLSSECCARIASHDGLEVIYTLIRSCNRSKPEMAMVVHCLSIITSLLQHESTRAQVMKNLSLGELMFELTRGYRDNSEIFVPACRLLHHCCQNAEHRAQLRQDHSYMKRLTSLINMTERKVLVLSKAKAALHKDDADVHSELIGLLKEIAAVLQQ
eukprot:m.219984 g.219984  ORF g.219984 m.219984 type:complete len:1667 (+) comp17006_c2_seq6:2063-7063(+)